VKAKFIKDFPTEDGVTITLKIPKDALNKHIAHELVDMRGEDVDLSIGIKECPAVNVLPSNIFTRLQSIDNELQEAIKLFVPETHEVVGEKASEYMIPDAVRENMEVKS